MPCLWPRPERGSITAAMPVRAAILVEAGRGRERLAEVRLDRSTPGGLVARIEHEVQRQGAFRLTRRQRVAGRAAALLPGGAPIVHHALRNTGLDERQDRTC